MRECQSVGLSYSHILLPPNSMTLAKSLLTSHGFSLLIFKARDLSKMALSFLLALTVL